MKKLILVLPFFLPVICIAMDNTHKNHSLTVPTQHVATNNTARNNKRNANHLDDNVNTLHNKQQKTYTENLKNLVEIAQEEITKETIENTAKQKILCLLTADKEMQEDGTNTSTTTQTNVIVPQAGPQEQAINFNITAQTNTVPVVNQTIEKIKAKKKAERSIDPNNITERKHIVPCPMGGCIQEQVCSQKHSSLKQLMLSHLNKMHAHNANPNESFETLTNKVLDLYNQALSNNIYGQCTLCRYKTEKKYTLKDVMDPLTGHYSNQHKEHLSQQDFNDIDKYIIRK